MKSEKNIGYTGICCFDVYRDGEYERTIEIQNQLTYGGQYNILHAISNSINNYINKFCIGNGSTAIDISNTIGSFENIFYKEVTYNKPTSSTSSTQELRVNWSLEISEYNGNTLSEIGLGFLRADSTQDLFCRVTLSGSDLIYKSPNVSLNGFWKITVTES